MRCSVISDSSWRIAAASEPGSSAASARSSRLPAMPLVGSPFEPAWMRVSVYSSAISGVTTEA